jgi:hypothetical protein
LKRLTFKNKGNGMLATETLVSANGETISAVVDTNTMSYHVVSNSSDKPIANGKGISVTEVKTLVKKTLKTMGVNFEVETRKKRNNVDQRIN